MTTITSQRTDLRSVAVLAAACAAWALSFVAPELIPDVGPFTIAGGRFLVFGTLSLIFWRREGPGAGVEIPWDRAIRHALLGFVGYYVLAVAAVQLAGSAMIVAVVGMTPVLYALVSAHADGRRRRDFAVSLTIITTALLIVNGSGLINAPVGRGPVAIGGGILLALAAMTMWITYAFDNASLMRDHPDITPRAWTACVGVVAGALAIPLFTVGITLDGGVATPGRFLLVVVILGTLPSFLATRAWNTAARNLPRTLTAQMMSMELVFGLLYSHLWHHTLPTPFVALGYVLLVVGALSAVAGTQATGGRSAVAGVIRSWAVNPRFAYRDAG